MLSHKQLLAKLEFEVHIQHMKNEEEHQKLRASLVEKYGEEGVAKVEAKIAKEKSDG